MPKRRLLSSLILLLTLAIGCGVDHEAAVDAKVNQEWMRPGMYVDAIEYLESGRGYHSARSSPGQPDLDQDAIAPFFKGLKEEFGAEQYAILVEDLETAWGFVVKLPADPPTRQRFEEYIEQVQTTFPGMILMEWGHEWVSFDFLDEDEAEFIREAEAAAEASS